MPSWRLGDKILWGVAPAPRIALKLYAFGAKTALINFFNARGANNSEGALLYGWLCKATYTAVFGHQRSPLD